MSNSSKSGISMLDTIFGMKFKATALKIYTHIPKEFNDAKMFHSNNKNPLANSIQCPKNEVNTPLPQERFGAQVFKLYYLFHLPALSLSFFVFVLPVKEFIREKASDICEPLHNCVRVRQKLVPARIDDKDKSHLRTGDMTPPLYAGTHIMRMSLCVCFVVKENIWQTIVSCDKFVAKSDFSVYI